VTEKQDNAAGRVAAYLDQHQAWMRQIGRPSDGVIAVMEIVGGVELAVGDVRAVLRQLDDAKTRNRELEDLGIERHAEMLVDEVRLRSEAELRAEVERLTRGLGEARGELARRELQRDNAHKARITAEQERDEARQLARYAYTRWPAPIFWQAAAKIESPYDALAAWLTADEPPTRAQETAQEAAGDDPGGTVGNDARDTLQGLQDGAQDAGSET
jgi:hypothetical protein